jgi:predicted nucleic acid-binding protein
LATIGTAEIVVADTSPLVTFSQAGAYRQLARYLGERVRLTPDVLRELETGVSRGAVPAYLLGALPAACVVELPPLLQQKAYDIIGFVRDEYGRRAVQDLGEVTSVLLAEHLRDDRGLRTVLLMDDIEHGKKLAAVRKLPVVDTQGLILEMVCGGVMPEALGGKVWRQSFSDHSKWDAYGQLLRERRGR